MSSPQAPIWELPDREQPIEGLDSLGQPVPEYAAALGLVSASPGRRAAAAAIDIGVFLLLQVPFVVWSLPLFWRLLTDRITWYGFVNHPDFLIAVIVAGVTVLLTILLLVTQLVAQWRWGFTLGKLALGLRVVNVRTLEHAGFWRVAWRALVVWAPVVTVVGTIAVLASPLSAKGDRLRGWHDRAGHTWLVDARNGLNPFDRKRMRIARKTVSSSVALRSRDLPSLATGAGEEVSGGYRPGARSSAGVLGVARPHAPFGRVTIGLAGLEPAEPALVGSTPVDRTGDVAGPPGGTQDRRVEQHPTGKRAAGKRVAGKRAATAPANEPATFAPPQQPRTTEQPDDRCTLLLDDGQRLQLSGPVVVGRAPAPVGDARPLAIADPGSSISKTHVVLRPVVAGIEVIDQGSTNGTLLVRDGREQLLAAGVVALARSGDTIRIGDRSARVLSA
ncbi:FHA domain-containing protein [Nocardioides glacieisoli]|uniref:FHA domain-containing protein n=1 Tax=Nocardioides glacieisoli TaxID=1168730 RepID=A0A4Q2S897_9ACTN|nr:RDD family protein [Nocardioides glacieisoli]RYB96639.1 FHA domain-containing protein [Nocardioides glacieisoli]